MTLKMLYHIRLHIGSQFTYIYSECYHFAFSRKKSGTATVKTMDNVRGHFAAFVAFKTKNHCHIIILLFETLQFWF